jgi:AbrB family transcriptional regulator, transcriptional pleiotropic regulator of transition state genes
MRATGVVRKIDDLGRIVLPKEIRTALNAPEKTPFEIFVSNDSIILRKYQPGCGECGDTAVPLFGETKICAGCLDTLYDKATGE